MATNDTPDNPAYVDTSALGTTKISGLVSAVTAIAGSVFGIVKASGAHPSEAIVIASLGVTAVGLIALAIIVAADLHARATITAATVAAGVATPTTWPSRVPTAAAPASGGPASGGSATAAPPAGGNGAVDGASFSIPHDVRRLSFRR